MAVRTLVFRGILVILCAAGFAYSLAWLIQTDKEKIASIIKTGAHAVESKDIDILIPYISEAYTGEYGESREELIARAREHLALVDQVSISIKKIDITFMDNGAADVVCIFFVSGYFTGSDAYNRIYFKGLTRDDPEEPEMGRFVFREERDGWKLTRAEIAY